MSAIRDLRNKIARLNGEKFTVAQMNEVGTSTVYSNIYRLQENDEIKEVGRQKEKNSRKWSTIYQATDKLQAGKIYKKQDDLPGWRIYFPQYFTFYEDKG